MDWKQNKIIFNYIANKKYLIKKDIRTNNTLYIKWDKFEMKCKYFMAFSIDSNNQIMWSCDNPYVDQKTKYLSHILKSRLDLSDKTYNANLLNSVKNLIQSNISVKYDDEKINFLWCLIGNYNIYNQFYIITDVVYL